MSLRLKSRIQACIGGFMFVDPAIDGTPLQDWGFNSLVTSVINRRLKNPRFGLSTDPVTVSDEVDLQNAQRMQTIRGGAYYVEASSYQPQPVSFNPLPVVEKSELASRPKVDNPKVSVVYIHVPHDPQHQMMAVNFVNSWLKHPPVLISLPPEHSNIDCELVVVCNGSAPNDGTRALFASIPNVRFVEHDNSGWDIGGFQLTARTVTCDLMLFFGSHAYLRRAGWLPRILEVYKQFGNALYGATGNQGIPHVNVHPHVRTTGFWCPPWLLSNYPYAVTQMGKHGQRYEMEHGQTCFTNWIRMQGFKPWIVGWNSVMPLEVCDSMPEGYHRGNQSNVLFGDRLTAPPYHAIP